MPAGRWEEGESFLTPVPVGKQAESVPSRLLTGPDGVHYGWAVNGICHKVY